MPPKPRFTEKEIVDVALGLVSEKGITALTARELGQYLGSSTRPIFTVFENMEEVQNRVKAATWKKFESYTAKAMNYTPAFKQVGMQMVLFAVEEPKLYQLLFMQENSEVRGFRDLLPRLGSTAEACLDMIRSDYGLIEAEANLLFENVWVYTYGIGALCATRSCSFSEEELVRMLGTDFMAMITFIKSGKMNEPTPCPERTIL